MVWSGELASTRRAGGQRLFDLAERSIPAEFLNDGLTDDECLTRLPSHAGTVLGVATADDLADYLRFPAAVAARLLPATGLTGYTGLTRLTGLQTFELDPVGRITSVDASQWTERYAYDEVGNQTEVSWPAAHPGHEATGSRAYSGTSITRAGRVRYEHDALGRTTLRQRTRLSRKPETWSVFRCAAVRWAGCGSAADERMAVPAVVLATLFVPPFGAALAFMARWDKAGRAVTVVLASVWFMLLPAAVSSGQMPVQDDAKPQVQPVVTVTVTAAPSPPPAPVVSSTPPVASPSPPTPPAPTASALASAAAVAPPPAERPPLPRPAAADDGKTPSRADAPAITRPSSSGGSSSSSGSGGGVSYRNCSAAPEAGAAPIRRGDAGMDRTSTVTATASPASNPEMVTDGRAPRR